MAEAPKVWRQGSSQDPIFLRAFASFLLHLLSLPLVCILYLFFVGDGMTIPHHPLWYARMATPGFGADSAALGGMSGNMATFLQQQQQLMQRRLQLHPLVRALFEKFERVASLFLFLSRFCITLFNFRWRPALSIVGVKRDVNTARAKCVCAFTLLTVGDMMENGGRNRVDVEWKSLYFTD